VRSASFLACLVGFLVLLPSRAHRSAQFGKGLEVGEGYVVERSIFGVDVGDTFLKSRTRLVSGSDKGSLADLIGLIVFGLA
jgi:hypothetical protein